MPYCDEEYYKAIDEKANQIGIDKHYLFAAIKVLAKEKVNKTGATNEDLFRYMLSAYAFEIAPLISGLPGHETRELTDSEFRDIAYKREFADALSFISQDEPVQTHHVKALIRSVEYSNTIAGQFPDPVGVIRDVCAPEILKLYFDLKSGDIDFIAP